VTSTSTTPTQTPTVTPTEKQHEHRETPVPTPTLTPTPTLAPTPELLPVTGDDLSSIFGAQTVPPPGTVFAQVVMLRTSTNRTTTRDVFWAPIVGFLEWDGRRLPLGPTQVTADELQVLNWAGGLSWSDVGGQRVSWHASQFPWLASLRSGDVFFVYYAGLRMHFQVSQVDQLATDLESWSLIDVPADNLLLVTCAGPNWEARTLTWAQPISQAEYTQIQQARAAQARLFSRRLRDR
jgi:hypothetical protein